MINMSLTARRVGGLAAAGNALTKMSDVLEVTMTRPRPGLGRHSVRGHGRAGHRGFGRSRPAGAADRACQSARRAEGEDPPASFDAEISRLRRSGCADRMLSAGAEARAYRPGSGRPARSAAAGGAVYDAAARSHAADRGLEPAGKRRCHHQCRVRQPQSRDDLGAARLPAAVLFVGARQGARSPSHRPSFSSAFSRASCNRLRRAPSSIPRNCARG